MLRMMARAASSQKSTKTALLSHSPTWPNPYWTMLMSIVPKETANAGTNNDSVGWVKEALNMYGWNQNRAIMRAHSSRYRTMLRKKKMRPMVCRPWKR